MRQRATLVLALETGAAVVVMGIVEAGFAPRDFMIYYAAAHAQRLHPALNIYRCTPAPNFASLPTCVDPHQFAYLYSPIFTIFFEPLTLLPLKASIILWYVVSGALLAVTLVLMQSLWPQSLRGFAGTCAALLLSLPFINGVQWGQVHILILLGYVLLLWLLQRERQVSAGIVLAGLIAIKLIPVLFLVYLIVRRQWRGVASTAIALMLGALVASIVASPLAFVYWMRALSGPLAQRMASISQGLNSPGGVWFTGGVLAIYGVVLWLGKQDDVGAFLWTLCTMLLISPVVEIHYLTWLAVPFVAWWARGALWLRIYVALCFASMYLSPINPIPAMLLTAWLIQGWLVIAPRLAPGVGAANLTRRLLPLGKGR